MHHELLTALRPYEQSVARNRNFTVSSTAYGVRATSPSQSNAVQCRGTQNSAATFSYTPKKWDGYLRPRLRRSRHEHQRSKRARLLDERDRQAGCNRRNSSVDG